MAQYFDKQGPSKQDPKAGPPKMGPKRDGSNNVRKIEEEEGEDNCDQHAYSSLNDGPARLGFQERIAFGKPTAPPAFVTTVSPVRRERSHQFFVEAARVGSVYMSAAIWTGDADQGH